MLSHFVLTAVALAVSPSIISGQQFTPTDQTSFSYPANGAGVTVPFPSEIAQLTGETDWPERWVTPPFTPNMQTEFNPSATAILNDIVVPPGANDFCQTFDDGPTNVTSILLDYLDSVSQRNTFFEIGTCVADNYLLTQREYASGHEIGVHTWSHPDLTTLTPQQVYAELAWTIYVIYASIGQTPKYFRPPYGAINDQVRQVAAQFNLTAVVWTDDSEDWEIGTNTTTEAVISSVAGFIAAGNPVILLEHDLREETVSAGQTISGMISQAGNRINAPIAAVFGDAQRYQGSKLNWPIVSSSGWAPLSGLPVSGSANGGTQVRIRDEGTPECPKGSPCPTP